MGIWAQKLPQITTIIKTKLQQLNDKLSTTTLSYYDEEQKSQFSDSSFSNVNISWFL